MSASRASKLRVFKYSPTGMMLPVVAVVAALGAFLALNSHAGTVTYVNFLDSTNTNTALSVDVTTIPDSIAQIGPRNVSQIAPGGKLVYINNSKFAYSSMCYYLRADSKVSGTAAKVEVVGEGNSKIVSLTAASDYQPVCVTSGKAAAKDYNVYNMSPEGGPYLLVDQAILSL